MLGSKISNAPRMTVLQFLFLHLELGRERKENYMMVGESKIGIDLQDILIDYVLP